MEEDKNLKEYDITMLYSHGRSEKTLLGVGILLAKVKEGLPFIIDDVTEAVQKVFIENK